MNVFRSGGIVGTGAFISVAHSITNFFLLVLSSSSRNIQYVFPSSSRNAYFLNHNTPQHNPTNIYLRLKFKNRDCCRKSVKPP